eukprot:366529-Chlamydomonas_euryale.AAC.3
MAARFARAACVSLSPRRTGGGAHTLHTCGAGKERLYAATSGRACSARARAATNSKSERAAHEHALPPIRSLSVQRTSTRCRQFEV